MATLQVIHPGVAYKVAKTGVPRTTIAKAEGVSILPPAGVLRKVGDTVTVADGLIYADQPLEVSVDLGTITPTDGGFSVVTGATAAARRIVNTTGTTPSPSLATDGYAVEGYASVSVIMQSAAAGNVTFELWAYDSVSATWGVCFDFGSSGQQIVNNQIYRITYLLANKSLDRLYLHVHANPGATQANAWLKLVPVITTF